MAFVFAKGCNPLVSIRWFRVGPEGRAFGQRLGQGALSRVTPKTVGSRAVAVQVRGKECGRIDLGCLKTSEASFCLNLCPKARRGRLQRSVGLTPVSGVQGATPGMCEQAGGRASICSVKSRKQMRSLREGGERKPLGCQGTCQGCLTSPSD